jgi:hypothetical protein
MAKTAASAHAHLPSHLPGFAHNATAIPVDRVSLAGTLAVLSIITTAVSLLIMHFCKKNHISTKYTLLAVWYAAWKS